MWQWTVAFRPGRQGKIGTVLQAFHLLPTADRDRKRHLVELAGRMRKNRRNTARPLALATDTIISLTRAANNSAVPSPAPSRRTHD
jgi:hypothetical protein